MKIDRMFFNKFEDKAKEDDTLKALVESERWDQAITYVHAHLFDRPEKYFNLDKLRHAAGVDRRLSLREILEKVFGLIAGFKSRDELLEDEFDKLLLDLSPEELEQHADAIVALKNYFKAYATDSRLRDIIEHKQFTELNINSSFSMADFKAVPQEWRNRTPDYIKDYLSLNQFM